MALELGAAGALRPGRRRRRRRTGVAAGSSSSRSHSSLVIGVVVIVVVASLLLRPMAAHGLLVGKPTIEATGGHPFGSRRSARGRPQPQDPPASSSSSSRVAPGSGSGSVAPGGGSSRRVRNIPQYLSSLSSSRRGDSSVAASAAPPSVTASVQQQQQQQQHQHQQETFVRWTRTEQHQEQPPPNSNASSTSASTSESDCWCLQTAVRTYERIQGAGGGAHNTSATTRTRVDLVSVVHLGEPRYYDDLHEELVERNQYDAVVYELLVDDVLLRPASTYEDHEDRDVGGGGDTRQLRVLVEPVGASDSDRDLARSYGLVCQADRVRYTSSRFVHGDWTRQELAQHLQRRQRQQEDTFESENHDGELVKTMRWPAVASPLASLLSSLRRQQLYQEEDPREPERTIPLWQQANRWSATHEAATALWVGPPILQPQATSSGRTRSSSNNSGSFRRLVQTRAIRWFLRPLLWLTVPSPEIPILLLDWSALDANSYNDSTDDSRNAAAAVGSISFPSPVSRAVLASLAAGQWDAARKLAFGQVLLVSSSASTAASSTASTAQPASSPDDLDWMQLRNQRAMEVADSILQRQSAADPATPTPASIAILYGCLHCPDLHSRLVRAGFTPIQKTWRTAWSVPVPAFTGTRLLDPAVLQLLALLVFYLGVGGLDWIATVGDVTHAAAGLVRDVAAPSATSSAPQPAAPSSSLSGLPAVFLSPSTWNVVEDYALYLVRHLFLYLGLSKFIWSGNED
jgi:hypothetical protein